MIRISKETRLTTQEVLDKAVGFFGEGGLGLDEKEKNPCCVTFEGGGGFVTIDITDAEKRTNVDVETREWEYQVKQFLGKL